MGLIGPHFFVAVEEQWRFELAQVGHAIQVVGLRGEQTEDGLTAFDIISEIGGAKVQ